ncbi:hypothetical protein NKH19_12980 [Mesorhizobium sp. M1338]|uniref:hypothetical protein n=1 Tax=unclassified Mesorhizobium TaxID=325217 RepID=UPI003335E16D
MLKKIALAAVLVQVAIFSALTTQTVLFASTANQAADARPGDPVSVTGGECAKATWPNIPDPNIPDHCLERIEARKLITTTLVIAGQQ